jgi:hypothetical protein
MNSELHEGDRFDTIDELKYACQNQALKNHFEFSVIRSSRTRYQIQCKDIACEWSLYATSIEKTPMFCIRKLPHEHMCFGLPQLSNKSATASFIAKHIQLKVQEQPEYRPKDILKDFQHELGIQIHYSKAFCAKESAFESINGNHQEAYRNLPGYCEALLKSNPGSFIDLQRMNDNKFRRVFLCYSASAHGFKYCRPLLGLDGTHLKAKYGGVLLAATAVDALGLLFPLAFGVVDAENDDNWLWFIENLRTVIETYQPFLVDQKNGLTFLSDRQKGLLEGVSKTLPNSAHGWCLKHLEENLHKKHKHPEVKRLVWQVAYARTEAEFNAKMELIRQVDAGAVE